MTIGYNLREAHKNTTNSHNKFLSFETLTLAPIDLSLIEINLLDKDEIEWLNDYHKNVYNKLSKKLNEEIKDWLKGATREISN